jgi:hypothetical protein
MTQPLWTDERITDVILQERKRSIGIAQPGVLFSYGLMRAMRNDYEAALRKWRNRCAALEAELGELKQERGEL